MMVISSLTLNAQTIMNIHQSNGTVLQLPINTIDSITYTISNSGGGISTSPGQGVVFNGYNYNSIILGNGQEWMTENLRTTVYSNGDTIPNITNPSTWSSLTSGSWRFYGDWSNYENPYGKLYNRYAVLDSRNVCPTGWHVPTYNEWSSLINYLDSTAVEGNNVNTAGGKMKSIGTQLWQSPNTGATNESGFSALPGGVNHDPNNPSGGFTGLTQRASWWISPEIWGQGASAIDLSYNTESAYHFESGSGLQNHYALSIRCLKGAPVPIIQQATLTTNSPSSIGDSSAILGGNIINDGGSNVNVRGVVWSTFQNPSLNAPFLLGTTYDGGGTGSFTSNLTGLIPNTTYYVKAYATTDAGTAYGNQITFTTTINCPAINTTSGAGVSFDGYNYQSVVFGNGQEWMAENLRSTNYSNGDPIPNITDNFQWDGSTIGAWSHYNNDVQYENPYGKLYNWYTVNDIRNVCPSGWHVPTNADWNLLEDYLCGEGISGGKMKSTGTQLWQSPNTGATNESGFSALPGGYRYQDGTFWENGQTARWWWFDNSGNFGTRYIHYSDDDTFWDYNIPENSGSIRCIKD